MFRRTVPKRNTATITGMTIRMTIRMTMTTIMITRIITTTMARGTDARSADTIIRIPMCGCVRSSSGLFSF